MAAAEAAECMSTGECPAEADVVESSLLQVSDGWKSKRNKYYIEMEKKKIPVPRREITSFPREVIFKYPLASNPIKVNGKTARLELGKMMESVFSRNALRPPADGAIPELTKPEEQRDLGVERAVAFIGKRSMISDKVKLAFAEKSHTLYIPEEVSHASEDRMKRVKAKQNDWDATRAKMSRDLRTTALFAQVAIAGPQLISAGKDQNVVAGLRDFAKADGGKPDDALVKAMEYMDKLLKEREAKRTRTTPVRSSIGCLHFENAELMNFTDEAVEVPLDTKLVAFRGRLASTPNKEYQMSSGIAIFHHNLESDTLDLYFGFSSVVSMADSAQGYAAVFSVGPADGDSMAVAPEGRAGSFSAPFGVGGATLDFANTIPPDFTFLHSPRQEVGCPDDVLDKLAKDVDEVQMNMMDPLNEVNCAVEFIKPWNKDEVVAFETIEAVGLIHVLMEMPGNIMKVGFSSSKLWNTITLF